MISLLLYLVCYTIGEVIGVWLVLDGFWRIRNAIYGQPKLRFPEYKIEEVKGEPDANGCYQVTHRIINVTKFGE